VAQFGLYLTLNHSELTHRSATGSEQNPPFKKEAAPCGAACFVGSSFLNLFEACSTRVWHLLATCWDPDVSAARTIAWPA
jgi:hypothetical protein